ncbi:hypothetical protein DFH29DRAFT_438487 [Suillus ampliporus]|nr:hypothetical protein DFH29DRAFT_438487 [Suillus ampliporus]
MPGPGSSSSDDDGESGEEALQPEEETEDAQVQEKVRVSDEREDVEGESGDVAEDEVNVEEEVKEEVKEEERKEDEEDKEEEEEESALRPRPSGRRRWIVASDDDDRPKALDRGSRLAADLQQRPRAPVVDDPQPSAPNTKKRASAIHAQDMPHVPDTERAIKKEKENPLAHRVRWSSAAESSHEGRAPSGASKPLGQPVKQEPISAGRAASQPQATQGSEPAHEILPDKLVISIQHKPSAQHSQFSAKPHTRVGKVLAGACKSFRLDVNVAQLYLVVITQNDQGLKEEDYFLCDRNETVEKAVVGVEGRAEFMVRMPADPAIL